MEFADGDPEELFEMAGKIGEGAYGIVCKCRRRETGEMYAAKVLEVDDDNSAVKREVDILKRCDSDLIVRYGGVYRKGSSLLIVMEYCDGGSVQDIVRFVRRKCSEEEVAAVIASVVQGLSYLHSNKIIHRDIKAGNVLLTKSGKAKLADFGVSTPLINTLQKTHSVIGSPYWMAPEVIAKFNDGYDSRADIWSLGITAIEMADQEPPRFDIHFARVIFIIPQQPPPTLKKPDNWSPEFNDFLKQCLMKDPAQRPTARQLLNHPFVKKGMAINSTEIIAKMVAETSPILEEARRKAAEAAAAQSDSSSSDSDSDSDDSDDSSSSDSDDSDSEDGSNTMCIKGSQTMELHDAQSDTFVEAPSVDDADHIEGLDYNNIKAYV